MNYSLLVRVLDCLTNLNKQLQAFDGREIILFAELGDFGAADQFHHKKWTAAVGGPGANWYGRRERDPVTGKERK